LLDAQLQTAYQEEKSELAQYDNMEVNEDEDVEDYEQDENENETEAPQYANEKERILAEEVKFLFYIFILLFFFINCLLFVLESENGCPIGKSVQREQTSFT